MKMKLSNYRTVDKKTNIESFNDGDDAIVIEWDGESKTISTFTSGSVDALYVGEKLEEARESLLLSIDEWEKLLRSENVEYLEKI